MIIARPRAWYAGTERSKKMAKRNTRELIESLPEKVRFRLELLCKDLQNDALSKDSVDNRICGYAEGLRDAGMITDHERGILIVHCHTHAWWNRKDDQR